MKTKKSKVDKNYNERVFELAYNTIRDALKSILNAEVKKVGADGKEAIDCGLTVSKMKMTARMALDFADNLKPVDKQT